MRRLRRRALVAFIRPYTEEDLQQIISIYQCAFAEPPWNEAWSAQAIIDDLRYAQSQPDSIVLVASEKNDVIGFAWGYRIPLEKFPRLRGIAASASYLDEIAIDRTSRCRGVGMALGAAYLRSAAACGSTQSVLRTDERNAASMGLFSRLGYVPLDAAGKALYDPQYPSRIYLQRSLP